MVGRHADGSEIEKRPYLFQRVVDALVRLGVQDFDGPKVDVLLRVFFCFVGFLMKVERTKPMARKARKFRFAADHSPQAPLVPAASLCRAQYIRHTHQQVRHWIGGGGAAMGGRKKNRAA